MGINKSVRRRKETVEWDGEEIADVRALGADDLAAIFTRVSDATAEIFSVVEESEFSMQGRSAEEVADFMLGQLPNLVSRVSSNLPELLAEIVIVASGDEDPEAARIVRDEWSLPMQMEGVACVFRATFVDDNAFRAFVGNVVALLKTGNALSSAPKKPQQQMPRGPQSLVDG